MGSDPRDYPSQLERETLTKRASPVQIGTSRYGSSRLSAPVRGSCLARLAWIVGSLYYYFSNVIEYGHKQLRMGRIVEDRRTQPRRLRLALLKIYRILYAGTAWVG